MTHTHTHTHTHTRSALFVSPLSLRWRFFRVKTDKIPPLRSSLQVALEGQPQGHAHGPCLRSHSHRSECLVTAVRVRFPSQKNQVRLGLLVPPWPPRWVTFPQSGLSGPELSAPSPSRVPKIHKPLHPPCVSRLRLRTRAQTVAAGVYLLPSSTLFRLGLRFLSGPGEANELFDRWFILC